MDDFTNGLDGVGYAGAGFIMDYANGVVGFFLEGIGDHFGCVRLTPIDDDWFCDWIESESTVAGLYKLALEPVYEVDEDSTDDKEKKTEAQQILEYFKVIDITLLYKLDE